MGVSEEEVEEQTVPTLSTTRTKEIGMEAPNASPTYGAASTDRCCGMRAPCLRRHCAKGVFSRGIATHSSIVCARIDTRANQGTHAETWHTPARRTLALRDPCSQRSNKSSGLKRATFSATSDASLHRNSPCPQGTACARVRSGLLSCSGPGGGPCRRRLAAVARCWRRDGRGP